MQYKDLIYKITSSKSNENKGEKTETTPDFNKAKLSVMTTVNFIGIMIAEDTILDKETIGILTTEIDRKLTTLFNSPISDTFAFLPYTKKTLSTILPILNDKIIYYMSDNEEYDSVYDMKKEFINFRQIFKTMNKKNDYFNKIDYLVTLNVDELDGDIDALIKKRNIMVFPIEYRQINNSSQKEKLIAPDPLGWVYNSASGVWVKNWGWDGSQELPGW